MKTAVAVLFGGKSVEHEISVISALQATQYLDTEKYDVIPVYITKGNEMYIGPDIGNIEAYKDIASLLKRSRRVVMVRENQKTVLTELNAKLGRKRYAQVIDVALPIVHGTNVEDGTLQGFLRLLDVPFAGCDVLSSALGMDKYMMKLVFRDAGIPVLECKCFLKNEFYRDEDAVIQTIEAAIPYPVIVKPANLGSSVGIGKARDRAALEEALELAFRFAEKVLVEPAIVNLREINCAVLGDIYEAEASECEEPLNATDILNYEDKYMSGGKSGSKGMASLARCIPANIPAELREQIRQMAVNAFKAIGAGGVARIDFMLDTESNQVYLNEINTIPGSLAFYLWEPLGVPYGKLLDRLIALALKRAREEGDVTYSFDTNILSGVSFGGAKGAKR